MGSTELGIAQNKTCAVERAGVSEWRHSRLPGKNQLAPAARVIKCWQLSMVLKSTTISLNGIKRAGPGAEMLMLLG